MYQPYPSAGQGPVPQQPGPPPRSVETAVKFMYAGAALSAIEIIIGLTTISSLRSAIRTRYPSYSASQIHTAEIAGVTGVVVIGLIAVGLWLWMAWANRAGKNWARIVASVLFALDTISFLISLAQPHATVGLLMGILVWLAGLGAIMFLWQRESSAYFQARSTQFR